MFTGREQELYEQLKSVVDEHKIKVIINSPAIPADPIVALDVEHDEQGAFVGCGLYFNSCNTVYYYSDELLFSYIDFSALSLICHNGVSDFDCLRAWGIDVKETNLFWDTQLLSHMHDSSRQGYGLKQLVNSDLGISYPSYDDIVGKRTKKQVKERRTLNKWPIEIVSLYNSLDCYVTYKLFEKQQGLQGIRPPASALGGLASSPTVSHSPGVYSSLQPPAYFEHLERPVAFILSQMESRGICVDLKYLESLKRELEAQFNPLDELVRDRLGVENVNSDKQVIEALENRFGLVMWLKGKRTRSKVALEKYKGKEIVDLLLAHSELGTLLDTFVIKYIERKESIAHPWFNQCGTRTGRLSCSNPNLLQIPRKTENGRIVRNMFKARSGMELGEADYAAIEPRVLAHLSKDPQLCGLFVSGVDFHSYTAERLNISRDKAKVLNLSVGYRASKYSVQRQLGGSLEEAQVEIDKWWNLFPALRRYQDILIFESKRSGYCSTLMGRKIKIEGLSDGNPWKREAAERQLINNVAQGSAAELIKLAMIQIQQIAPNLGLLIQIYDSLVWESPDMKKDIQTVVSSMEQAYKLDVPLVCEVKTGLRWGEMAKYES